MITVNTRTLTAGLAVALCTASVLATENNNETENDRELEAAENALETVVVTAKSYRTTGTKSDLPAMQAPMSFEVYSADLLNLRQVDSVNDALRYVAGITPENRATVTIFDQYNIRGFESSRNFYDGLALQTNNLWNLTPQVDAFATDSVEVLKGPTSVLYGSAPPGGMINQVAKQPMDGQYTHLRLRAGSFALRELGVDHNGELGQSVNYRLIALGRERDGQMRTTQEERYVFAPSATWRASSATTIQFNAYYQDDPAMIPSTPLPGPGTVFAAEFGELDAKAYAGDANWNSLAREVTMLGYKLNHEFSDALTFLQKFRHTEATLLQRNTYHQALNGAELIRNAYLTDEAISGYAVDNQIAWHLEMGGLQHKFLFGLDYQTLGSDIIYQDTFGVGTPTINLAQPNYRQMQRDAITENFQYRQTNDIAQQQLGLYAQNEMRLGSFTVLANLRRDKFTSEDNADFGGAPGTTDIDQQETSGRLAGIYAFSSGWAPYISYAESFEPTAGVDTFTGEAFKPTTAKQIEAGAKFQNSASTVAFTAALFDIAQQNVVVNTPDFLQRTQRGELSSQGIELALTARISEAIELITSYGYQNVEVSDNPLDTSLEGKSPVWVSDQQASLWGTYYFHPAASFSLGLRHIGESQVDALNTATVPSYTLLDVAGQFAINSSVSLALSVSNLADKRYVGACFDRNNCWMGAARNAELSLNVNF